MVRQTIPTNTRKMIMIVAGVTFIVFGAFYVFSSVDDKRVLTPATTTTTPATPR
jgi:hypothetical protein